MNEPTFTFAHEDCEHCQRYIQQALDTMNLGFDIVSIGNNYGHAIFVKTEEEATR